MKPEEFIDRLKRGSIGEKRVFAVLGKEGYYRDLVARSVEERVFQGLAKEGREIVVFEKNLSLERLKDAVNTYPFFTGRSLVVVKDEKFLGGGLPNQKAQLEDAKKRESEYRALADILLDAPDYCYVLVNAADVNIYSVFYKRLFAAALLYKCDSPEVNGVDKWLEVEAGRRGGELEKEAVEFIKDYLAPLGKASLTLLSAELDKLAAFAYPRKTWTRTDVEAVFSDLPDAAPFIMAKFIKEGRARDFLRALSLEKKKGTEIIAICGQIIYELRKLAMDGEQAASYGYGRKALQASGYGMPAIRETMIAVSNLSRDVRCGGRGFDRLEEIMTRLFKARAGRK